LFLGFLSTTFARAPLEAQVRHVLDGDSFVLANGNQVRLIGINAPEMSPQAQPLARAAKTLLAQLVEGRRVKLIFEEEKTDRHRRTLAHALLIDGGGEKSVEEILLRQGLAWSVAIPPNVAWATRLGAAESEARTARRGVWGEPAYAPIAVENLPATETGFRLLEAQVKKVTETPHVIYFDLTPGITMLIPREDWTVHFAATHPAPKAWVGRRFVVRGWLTAHERGRRVRVQHPGMLSPL
jgi:endonuclease YncB( thermonuclease family)